VVFPKNTAMEILGPGGRRVLLVRRLGPQQQRGRLEYLCLKDCFNQCTC
jgi:hypothetical protein